ncbi:Zn(II)2Cys6 transcription factor [Aspergillus saccharolyticus JOP 1030-1]|uniref:Zn(2)-C6 fungal-type domain-containing protein n=1 Tax=Aspergillus saccharolyticus JOP 1030-1 TaxID=1450539 RepID=A0A318Z165_9EURO|nr:hypothetical protein BP01DRAFT_328721 [Aspergillus saccharolyticus JOP 1030-1]PYH41035.1 hypothetical protein BP01DRAFT_328721 [Aspergillus saccharolyticus JOP 1030-1]
MSATLFLDKPLLKVSRPVAACSRCRTAKIKCDGKLPACSACERVGKSDTCSGASDEFARGKERSYVASLEGYCERLEKKIAELRQLKTSLSVDDRGIAHQNSITSITSAESAVHGPNKEVSDIDDLVGDFGFLSVNATSRDFHGITSSTSFANLLLSLSLADPLPKRSLRPLPPRHEITHLLQHYFDTIYIQLPFFAETNFWTSVDAVYQSGGRFAKPFDHWIVHTVLATSSASLSYEWGDESQQDALSYITQALQRAEDVLRPGSIQGIQAIMLLAQYSLFDPKHFRSWFLVGMAVRVMVDLGLHQDPPVEVQSSTKHLDLRRRILHCLYSLDRGASTVFERPFSFSDESVNVALPSSTTPSEQNHLFLRSSEPAWHLVKIRQILSGAYSRNYFHDHDSCPGPRKSTWSLGAEAYQWFDAAPSTTPSHFPVLYKLELLYTVVMILSSSDEAAAGEYRNVVLFERCMQYLGQIQEALRNPAWSPFLTFWDMHRALQAIRRLTRELADNHDLALSPSVPVLPPVPPETPSALVLDSEDCLNFYARATACLSDIQCILRFGLRKWGTDPVFEEMQQLADSIQARLISSPAPYLSGSGAYAPGYSPMVPAGAGYPAYDIG